LTNAKLVDNSSTFLATVYTCSSSCYLKNI